jgi:hypothetical protein
VTYNVFRILGIPQTDGLQGGISVEGGAVLLKSVFGVTRDECGEAKTRGIRVLIPIILDIFEYGIHDLDTQFADCRTMVADTTDSLAEGVSITHSILTT